MVQWISERCVLLTAKITQPDVAAGFFPILTLQSTTVRELDPVLRIAVGVASEFDEVQQLDQPCVASVTTSQRICSRESRYSGERP